MEEEREFITKMKRAAAVTDEAAAGRLLEIATAMTNSCLGLRFKAINVCVCVYYCRT
jgi:hypothetical protein